MSVHIAEIRFYTAGNKLEDTRAIFHKGKTGHFCLLKKVLYGRLSESKFLARDDSKGLQSLVANLMTYPAAFAASSSNSLSVNWFFIWWFPLRYFDADKMKCGDLSEIKSAAKKFQHLTLRQKDLIRHQAPDSYAAIVKIAEMAKSSQETAFKAQAHASNNFHNFSSEQASNRFSTRGEKNDSYAAADRAHERTTRSQEFQNTSNNESYVKIALVTGFTVVAGVAMAIFGGNKKS